MPKNAVARRGDSCFHTLRVPKKDGRAPSPSPTSSRISLAPPNWSPRFAVAVFGHQPVKRAGHTCAQAQIAHSPPMAQSRRIKPLL